MKTIETIKKNHSTIVNTIKIGECIWCNSKYYTVKAINTKSKFTIIKVTNYKGDVSEIVYDTNKKNGKFITKCNFKNTEAIYPLWSLSL